MERECIDGVQDLFGAFGAAMALECVFVFLHGGVRVEVLDGDSSLDAGECVAGRVGEAPDAARLVHQRALAPLLSLAQVAQVVDQHLTMVRAHHETIA